MGRSKSLGRIPLMPLAGLAIVVVAGIAAILLSFGVVRANHWVAHSIRTQTGVATVGERLATFESIFRGYLIHTSPTLLAEQEQAKRDLFEHLETLRRDTADNPVQQANVARLDRLLRLRVARTEQLMAIRRHGSLADLSLTQGNRARLLTIRQQLARMAAEEDRLFVARQRWLQTLTFGLALFLASAVLIVVVVAYLTINEARARYREVEQAHAQTRAEMQKREALEGQVRQLQKMETIGQLTGGIAHDFNNMLAVIVGSLDMAKRRGDGDPAQMRRHIDTAFDGAERAAALVARLLAFSRRQPLSPVALDANRLITGMSDLLRRTLGEQVTVETALTGGLWHCFADPGQLENAILNLAVNARDAMEGGDGRLTIATANVTVAETEEAIELAPGEYVSISVADTGIGMAADVIERAFDPFFTTKEVGKGTGLGLSQVFGFARQSGGSVTISSVQGEGATVRLHLPRYQGMAKAPDRRGQPKIPGARAGETVLVAEDEPHVRTFSVEALRELGYAVLSAENGEEALRILDANPRVTLLFTDMMMPGMTGRALADAALERHPRLRLLFTTGYAAKDLASPPEGDGALLPKPFTMAQLALKVRGAIDAG
jgi:signal transduction histidine kinase